MCIMAFSSSDTSILDMQHAYHYSDVIMDTMASQITSLAIVYSTVYSGTDQRKHQSSAALAFVWGIHRWPVNSPPKRPVTRKRIPFDDVIMENESMLRLWDMEVHSTARHTKFADQKPVAPFTNMD